MVQEPRVQPGHSAPIDQRDTLEIVGIIAAPLALLVGLSVKYALVDVFGCRAPGVTDAVHATAALTLLVCMAGVLRASAELRLHAHGAPRMPPGQAERRRTLDWIGLSISAMCAIVVLAQWLPQFVLPLCQQ